MRRNKNHPEMNIPQLSASWPGKGLQVKGTPWGRQSESKDSLGSAKVRNLEVMGSGHQTKARRGCP